MITVELATRLRDAGLAWTPERGDRFVVPGKGMDDQVFLVSDMVVEVQDLPAGRIMKFNGTTEWALDSVDDDEVVWLPREDQLRDALGSRFVALESVTGGYAVSVTGRADRSSARSVDSDPERAYARAVLGLLSPA